MTRCAGLLFSIATVLSIPAEASTRHNLDIEVLAADPAPNYPLTRDADDLQQLTDHVTHDFPIWTKRDSVAWVDRTPVQLTVRLPAGEAVTFGARRLRLLTAKSVRAGALPPRRIDLYCPGPLKRWFRAGSADFDVNTLGDEHNLWLDVELSPRCHDQLVAVIHGTGNTIALDELELVADGDLAANVTDGPADLDGENLRRDSIASLKEALGQKELRRRAEVLAAGNIHSSQAWIARPWEALGVSDIPADMTDRRTVTLHAASSAPVSYAIGLVNGTAAVRKYRLEPVDGWPAGLQAFELQPLLAANGEMVYDAMRPLAVPALTVPVGGQAYLFLRQAAPAADQRVRLSVKADDGFEQTLTADVRVYPHLDGQGGDTPDVIVWGYTIDQPIWSSLPKLEMLQYLRAAGVNVFLIPPGLIPLPGSEAGWRARQTGFERELRLYAGAGRLLLALGWDQNLAPVGSSEAERRGSIRIWLSRVVAAMEKTGYRYEDWAVYPIDEPHGALLPQLLNIAQWIKEYDPRIRIYANPDESREWDLVSRFQLSRLAKMVDHWQPKVGVPTQIFKAAIDASDRGRWSVYWVGNFPARAIPPLCYRKLAWDAAAAGAAGFGFWSFSDTGGSSAWDDFDGTRPDWSVVYEGKGRLVSGRRWESFKAGITDFRIMSACRRKSGAADVEAARECSAWQAAAAADFTGLECNQ